ncbi:hypothetical protein QA645_32150 [Bradyrhizobium sp. CIAT3101]|uniref:hypothetical protein n=1 Tax=Bradyrhizobium sp. CIAT3101 TaxID=439387 RepID=UPI0024B0B79D|nr:hypothetical protein [Bradyrhizobium sp. CIAT3101]WFU79149.1 hypothetical protein QA645_32150 [Bradyrhizobium sp. CIAT3101]
MSEPKEALIKVIAISVSLFILWALQRARWDRRQPLREHLLWCLVAIGALGYINFGGFHIDGTPFHIWDQYHYVLGSKYFPELGYDGIYVATIEAFEEKDPTFVPPSRIRDLRTNDVVPREQLAELQQQVRMRFSDPRWAAFREDATHYRMREDIFLDHGYNPPPCRAAIERLFTAWLPFRGLSVALYASLDFLLLALAGLVVYRTFGLVVLAAISLSFGLGYCSRYFWIGGAFLRQDVITALLLCAASLATGRMRLAGGLLAYATCCRVFPFFMLLPLTAFAAFHWRKEGERAVQFALGFAGVAALLFIAGCLAGRGAEGWLESLRRLWLLGGVIGPNAVGLKVPFSSSVANMRGELVDPSSLYVYTRIATDVAKTEREHLWLIIVASLAMTTAYLRVAWLTRDIVTVFASGVAAITIMTSPGCYYASFFILLALINPLRTATSLLVANMLMYLCAVLVVMLFRHGIIELNGAALYAPVSVLLLLALLDWLWNVLRSTTRQNHLLVVETSRSGA